MLGRRDKAPSKASIAPGSLIPLDHTRGHWETDWVYLLMFPFLSPRPHLFPSNLKRFPMKRLYLLLLLCGAFALTWAQKTVKSSGEFQVMLTREMSEAQACETCIQQAMIQAIEKAFGRVIIQGNTTVIENINTGETVQTSQTFNLIAESYVNGNWIETLQEDCERFVYHEDLWVRCSVKGRVQELIQPAYDLKVMALDCEDPACQTERFVNGEPLYLFFKAPVDGYLTIYLGDPTITQRLLPYSRMPRGMVNALPVEADEEYILFSQDQDPFDLGSYVDEYEMYTDQANDQNRLYVIFSREPLVKPSLYAGEDPGGDDMDVPWQLTPEDFQKWLAKQRRYNPDIQVQTMDILISEQ